MTHVEKWNLDEQLTPGLFNYEYSTFFFLILACVWDMDQLSLRNIIHAFES